MAVAAITATAAIVVVVTLQNRTEPIALGQQTAAAQAAEAARLKSGAAGPSPMPEGGYDQEKGDYDLAAVIERPLDQELRNLARAFEGWPPEKRAENRHRISMEEQYRLIHFAKRSSVLALQERSRERCEDGLLALAMIDETRIDARDASWAVGLLAHAVQVLRMGGEPLVEPVAALATPGMAKILMRAREGSDLSEWGYTQVQTATGGVGLVRSGFEDYEPTLDMTGLALRLAAALQKGRYIAEPEIRAEVPAVWFQAEHRSEAERLLTKARAGISVTGALRRGVTAKPSAQQFTQWVVEMPGAKEADALVQYVGMDARRGSRFAIGVASGRLFSLIVAGSFMEGVEPFESPESLAALADETRSLLSEVAR